MRALALTTVPATPSVIEIDVPRPAVGEVLVEVASASVNGFDVAVAAGKLRDLMEHRFPLVLGKDYAGTITEVGEGVEGFAVGDRVFGVLMAPFLQAGTLARYAAVPTSYGLARIPEGLSFRDAGALGLAGTAALNSLDTVEVGEGDTVLISGATGGVGAFAVQLAAARGARVIATARPGAEEEFVTGLAEAVQVVDHTDDLESAVRKIAPDGVDVILHLAGDVTRLASLLAKDGRIASTLGLPADAVDGVTLRSVMADPTDTTLTTLAELVAAGKLRVPIGAVHPLERAPEAFAAFTKGAIGKIAIACS